MKVLLSLFLMACSLPAMAGYCTQTKTIEYDFTAADFAEMELKALAGELEVTASDDEQVHFWGKVCTDEETHLDMIDLDILKSDGKLKLVAIIPYHQKDFDPNFATMDIELSLPATLPLRLRDSSGDMTVTGVSVISIEDSSGNIRVRDGKSDISLRDSSGQIYVRGVEGSVTVSDSSGDIDLNNISGDVFIPGDSSGDVEVSRVSGTVNIDRDGSGDIDINDVGKDVLIGSDGSGDINIEDVKGMVRIDADGSGSVSIEEVAGNFELGNKGEGDIRTADIAGTIDTPR